MGNAPILRNIEKVRAHQMVLAVCRAAATKKEAIIKTLIGKKNTFRSRLLAQ